LFFQKKGEAIASIKSAYETLNAEEKTRILERTGKI
jgi:hypothetical protein